MLVFFCLHRQYNLFILIKTVIYIIKINKMERCTIDVKHMFQILMAISFIFFCILMFISFFIKDDIPPEEEKKMPNDSLDI